MHCAGNSELSMPNTCPCTGSKNQPLQDVKNLMEQVPACEQEQVAGETAVLVSSKQPAKQHARGQQQQQQGVPAGALKMRQSKLSFDGKAQKPASKQAQVEAPALTALTTEAAGSAQQPQAAASAGAGEGVMQEAAEQAVLGGQVTGAQQQPPSSAAAVQAEGKEALVAATDINAVGTATAGETCIVAGTVGNPHAMLHTVGLIP